MEIPNLESFSNTQLIEVYPKIIKLLKQRDVIRSKNFIGEIGEYLAVSHYNGTPNKWMEIPNLESFSNTIAPTATRARRH